MKNLLNFRAGNQILRKVLAYGNFIAAQRGIVIKKLLTQLGFKLKPVHFNFIDAGENGAVGGLRF